MKVIYRILEKEQRGGGKYRLRGEVFFTSRKKAVDYLHKKYESSLPSGSCLEYKEGEWVRITTAPVDSDRLIDDTKKYELDVVPVN